MLTRLHRQLAATNFRATLARMGARHWFAGCNWPVNDNGVI